MPFNAEQLAYGGRAAINFFLKNDPVDQINIAHPLFNKLVADKREYVGGKQYVVEQIREAGVQRKLSVVTMTNATAS